MRERTTRNTSTLTRLWRTRAPESERKEEETAYEKEGVLEDDFEEHLQRRAQGPPDSCGARTFGAVVRKSAWPTAAASRHCHLMDTQRNRKRSPLLRTKGSPLLLCSPTSLEHGKGKAVSHSDRRRVLQIRCCEHTNK
ncbi:hypothetical protein NN561_011459 [Cricetulus griseus]